MFATFENMPMFARWSVVSGWYHTAVDVDHLGVESDVFGVGGSATDAAGIDAVGFWGFCTSSDELEGTVLFVEVEVDGEVGE